MASGPLIPVNGQVLREVQADHPIELNRQLGPSAYLSLPGQDSALREYLRVLIKRKWLVFSCLAIIFGVVALATMRSTRIYDAVGSIAINKTDPAILNLKESGSGGVPDYYDPTDLDTEVRILRSDLLALQVIKQLNLDKQPEFGGTEEAPSDSLGLTTDALQPDSETTTALLAGFKGGLRVALVPSTRIIEIHYRSADKNLASSVVNTLINTYIEQNFKTRFESTMQASDWLSKQMVDLQMRVQTSQESWCNTRNSTRFWELTKNRTSLPPN